MAGNGLTDMLGCDVTLGSRMTLVFPLALLGAANPVVRKMPATAVPGNAIPDGADVVRLIKVMIALDLLNGLPSLDRLGR